MARESEALSWVPPHFPEMSGSLTHPDVFVAFHPADAEWVKGLITFLTDHDIGVSSELELLTGDNWVQRLEVALATARRLILVISPEAMADSLLDLKRHAMLIRAVENGLSKRTVLPVMIHSSPLPATLSVFANCDLSCADDAGYLNGLRQLLTAIPERKPAGDLLRPSVKLPRPPKRGHTDTLWPQLIEVYGELTGDPFKLLFLAKNAFGKGVMKREDLDAHSGAIAANLYLTRLGSREHRAQMILDDMRELSTLLRTAPRYNETVEALEKALQSTKPAGSDGPAFVATPLTFDQQLALYLPAAREANRFVPIVGVQNRIKLDLALEQIYVPLRARFHRMLGDADSAWSFRHQAAKGTKTGKRRTGRHAEPVQELHEEAHSFGMVWRTVSHKRGGVSRCSR